LGLPQNAGTYIFVKFSLAEGSNAKDFTDDTSIEALGVSTSFPDWGKSHDANAGTAALDQMTDSFPGKTDRSVLTANT
jgi:hypothetical protein